MGWNPSRSDPHEAIDDPAAYHHRITSNIKHLLIETTLIRAESPVPLGLVDRVHDGAIGFLFAPIMLHERVKVVIRIGENVITLVRIVHSVGSRLNP
jgi:hypothetical protein